MRRALLSFARPWASLAAAVLLAAAPALAQEGEASPADSTIGWIFRWLNFALVFGGIGYAAVKYGGPYFRKKAEEISRKIEEGTRAREVAEQQRREVLAKLANLEQDIAALRAEARQGAETEAKRLRALARAEAEKIEHAAQAEIGAAERAARLELKAVGARLAVERAEAVLREELTPKAQAALLETFVAELERSAN